MQPTRKQAQTQHDGSIQGVGTEMRSVEDPIANDRIGAHWDTHPNCQNSLSATIGHLSATCLPLNGHNHSLLQRHWQLLTKVSDKKVVFTAEQLVETDH